MYNLGSSHTSLLKPHSRLGNPWEPLLLWGNLPRDRELLQEGLTFIGLLAWWGLTFWWLFFCVNVQTLFLVFYGVTNSVTILRAVQFALSLLEADGKVEESIHTLERTKEELLKQRELLEQKLQDGSLLDPKEERRLTEYFYNQVQLALRHFSTPTVISMKFLFVISML